MNDDAIEDTDTVLAGMLNPGDDAGMLRDLLTIFIPPPPPPVKEDA